MNTALNISFVASAMIRLLFVAGFMASACLTQAQTSFPLVPTGAVWKYLDIGADLGTTWIAPGFNDSAWPSGPAQLGYGDGDEATAVGFGPDPNNRFITTYFRRSFVVNDASAVTNLSLRLLVDDGAVVYLNGLEAFRANLPMGATTFHTLAVSSVENAICPATLSPTLLVNGTNVVAVEVHQNMANSSDLSFDLEMTVLPAQLGPAVVINEVLANNLSFTNADGTVTAWIELRNVTSQPLDLTDFSLSDEAMYPRRWTFPVGTTVPPNGFLIVRCDSNSPPSTNMGSLLNTGFSLKANGDTVYLFDRIPNDGGALLDEMTFGLQAADFSLGRVPDGTGAWVLCRPAAAAPNVPVSLGSITAIKLNEWMSHPQTDDSDWFELYNPLPQPVVLGGCYLTDALNNPTQYCIPPYSYLGSGGGGFVVFYADHNVAAGADHTGFRLGNGGGEIGLFSATGEAIDTATYAAQPEGISEGRLPDGGTTIVQFPGSATPGASNHIPATEPPSITQQPANQTVVEGSTASFTVTATGTAPLSYQWQKDGANLNGQTSATLTLASVELTDAGHYRVIVSNIAASVTSTEATLTVTPGSSGTVSLVPMGAVWQYLDTGVDQGIAWIAPGFNDTAWPSGPAQLGYGDGDEATTVGFGPDLNNRYITTYFRRSFVLNNATAVTNLSLRLLVDDGAVVYLNGAEVFRANLPAGVVNFHTLAISAAENAIHSVSLGPALLLEGTNIVAVEVHQNSASSSDLSFDLELVAGGGGSIPPLPGVLAFGAADYTVDETSVMATVSVLRTDGSAGSVSVEYFTANGTAAAGLDYQVRSGSLNFTDGETSQTFAIPIINDSLLEQTETVLLVLTNVTGGATFPGGANAVTATLNIVDDDSAPTAPTIAQQPVNQTAAEGGAATFAVTATGTPPLSYQWQKDGTHLIGETNATLALSGVQSADAGSYRVVVSNACGSVTSQAACLTVVPFPTGPGSVDLSFDPYDGQRLLGFESRSGAVGCFVRQPDGRIIAGGQFVGVNGVPRRNIARLNADGSVDADFDTSWGANDFVSEVALQPDGKVLLCGAFTVVNGQPRHGLARLHPDGRLDRSFTPDFSQPAYSVPGPLVVQPDGKILVRVTVPEASLSWSGHLFRLNPDGSVDASFHPACETNVNYQLNTFALQADGTILVGGTAPPENRPLMRLHADGSLDTSLAAEFCLNIYGGAPHLQHILVEPDGKIILSGRISLPSPGGGILTASLVRLNADGSYDTVFSTHSCGWDGFNAMATQSDGKVLLGGGGCLKRALTNGLPDTAFAPDPAAVGEQPAILAVAVMPEGKILVGKRWDRNDPSRYNGLALLNPDGSADDSFRAELNLAGAHFYAVAAQPDGTVLAAGSFTCINGVARNASVARFQADGSLDPTFNSVAPTNDFVFSLATQPDGKVILARSYSVHTGESPHYLVRLDAQGNWDATFQPQFDSPPWCVAVQPDGRILAGGWFTSVDGMGRDGLVRLLGDGTLDLSFNPGTGLEGSESQIRKIVLQSDGKMLIGGEFPAYNGIARTSLARVNPDGSLDETFVPPNLEHRNVTELALQPDGRVLVGLSSGIEFDVVGRRSLLRLDHDGSLDTTFLADLGDSATVYALGVEPDGQVVVGGYFNFGREGLLFKNLARLNPDGSLDTRFVCELQGHGDYNVVEALALQADGQILVGGYFSSVNGVPCDGLVRLIGDAPGLACHLTAERCPSTGQPRINLTGPVGAKILVEATSDFHTWTPVMTVTNTLGCVQVSDPTANGSKQRFYRARLLE
jgi:uncharacterized delta-60 repeat protein